MAGNELPPIRPLTKKHYLVDYNKASLSENRVKREKLFRIQKICLSLFKQIQGYEEDLEREMTPGRNYRRKKQNKFDKKLFLSVWLPIDNMKLSLNLFYFNPLKSF